MFNIVDRGKAFALFHLLYSVINLFIHVMFNRRYWYREELDKALFFIYFGFCFVWCINDIIALLGIDEKKKNSLQCHMKFGIAILIIGVPYLIVLLYFALLGKVTVDDGSIFQRVILPVLMFLGLVSSLISMYYCYQINKECSATANGTENVPEDVESNTQKGAKKVKEDK